MPDSSVDVFKDRLADISNSVQKENKLFYLLGDLNKDLFKYDMIQNSWILFTPIMCILS